MILSFTIDLRHGSLFLLPWQFPLLLVFVVILTTSASQLLVLVYDLCDLCLREELSHSGKNWHYCTVSVNDLRLLVGHPHPFLRCLFSTHF